MATHDEQGNPWKGYAIALSIAIPLNGALAWVVMVLFHLAYWQALLIVLALVPRSNGSCCSWMDTCPHRYASRPWQNQLPSSCRCSTRLAVTCAQMFTNASHRGISSHGKVAPGIAPSVARCVPTSRSHCHIPRPPRRITSRASGAGITDTCATSAVCRAGGHGELH